MANNEDKLRLGLPKGSLNTPDRACTSQFFKDSDYDIEGYEPGNERQNLLIIKNEPKIKPYIIRPQDAASELSKNKLDCAIVGNDWIEEYMLGNNKSGIEIVGDLGYGKVRLVFAVDEEAPFNSLEDFFIKNDGRDKPIEIYTEYLNIAKQAIMNNSGYKKMFGDITPLVERTGGYISGENKLVQIIKTCGATETQIEKGADMIFDNTQTGSSLKRHNLKILEESGKSSVGLYKGPTCIGWKEEKARDIFENLLSAVLGKQYFDLKFNVPNKYLKKVKKFLIGHNLCSDEPTITKGREYSSVNIVIKSRSFPQLKKDLKNYEVSAIVRNEIKQYIP